MERKQYDKIAEEYSRMLNPTKKYVLVPTFEKIIANISDKKILDLGCGEGFFTRILAQLNPTELVGIDISKELIKKAIEKGNQQNLEIKYLVGDVLKLQLERKFDLITAVYLLNYSQNEDELFRICENIYGHLADRGKFCAITTNPTLKPMENFEYERRFTNISDKKFFKNGDQIKVEMREKGKKPFEFINYYWSKETYEHYLRKAGFKSIQWIGTIISKEGIKKYGNEYWDKFRKNPSFIGIICKK